LALLFLARWNDDKKHSSAIIFIVFFALSIFSKEDFILPPLLLLGWYIAKDGEWKHQMQSHKWLISATIILLLFFLAFNKILIPGRSYMDPVAAAKSPYFMTLNPVSVAKVAFHYLAQVGTQLELLNILYVAVTIFALVTGRKVRETILVALIVASLMAPYLIMPNHIFSYYGLKWWVWESLVPFVLLQIVFAKRGKLVSGLVGALLFALVLVNIVQHRGMNWNISNYVRARFVQSENLRDSIISNRDAINAAKQVAVTGIGPGQIDQTPWQGNGETEFFLRDDLKLSTQWIVFVKTGSPSYVIDASPGLDSTAKVIVKSFDDIQKYKYLPRFEVAADGHGSFAAAQ
jgi:hypothetical protein